MSATVSGLVLAVDWAATWRLLVGVVCHVCGRLADISAVHRVHGPRWTGSPSNRDCSTPIRWRETKGKVPHHLHSATNEPAMTGDEPNTMVSAGMAFPTTSLKTKSMEVKHGISQTQWGTKQRQGARRGDGPTAVPWTA